MSTITGTSSALSHPTASTKIACSLPHDDQSNEGTAEVRPLERATLVRQPNKYSTKSLYKHNPCPLLHLDAKDASCVSGSSSGAKQSYQARNNMHSRDIVKTWLLNNSRPSSLDGSQHRDAPLHLPQIITTRVISDTSTASSQASPLSDVFTNSSPPDDLVSDISSMMGSCILNDNLSSRCPQDETNQGQGREEEQNQRDVPTQAKLQAGLYTSTPLTPANLQRYMDSYAKRPKHKPQPRPKPSEPLPRSGWVRMLESTRKMEREKAIKREQDRGDGNEFAKWRTTVMPWM
ncbi:hypothetical protein FRC10_003836 [Ceratobasidium sp. 414]|nr:hypothetical protein FRC10_003836 [Ceratobasidium sp. 414]